MAARPIVHLVLMAKDRTGLASFYATVFGWNVENHPAAQTTSFSLPGLTGTILQTPEDQPSKPIICVQSDNIEADLRAVAARGGKILAPKTELPPAGWVGFCADPQGTIIGLYERQAELAHGSTTSARQIVHLLLAAKDRVSLAQFYDALFEWPYQDSPAKHMTAFSTPHLSGSISQAPDDRPVAATYFIYSEDIDVDLAQISNCGGIIVVPKTAVPGVGWLAYFYDPCGTMVGLSQFLDEPAVSPPHLLR